MTSIKNDPTSPDQQSREEVNVDRLDRTVVSSGRTRIRAELFVQKFSHQRVGSSILASLSEAGGNDL